MNGTPMAAARLRRNASACGSPFWSTKNSAAWSLRTRPAAARNADVVLPDPVAPAQKMWRPERRGTRGPVSSAVIGTYGSLAGHGRSRTIWPCVAMCTRSPAVRLGRGCHSQRRARSCARSSSPAPRSDSRHRRPTALAASTKLVIGAITIRTFVACACSAHASRPAAAIAARYRLRIDTVVCRRSHHANSTPAAPATRITARYSGAYRRTGAVIARSRRRRG